jgi:CheY-like chemotaxis protein
MARVFLIDPDRRALVTVQRALREAGFTGVTAVPSGSWALTKVESVRTPDIDGFELCAIIRSDPGLQGVRFLLLADGPDEMPEDPLQAGADRILVGDLEPAAIVEEIQKLLAADGAERDAGPVIAARPGRGGLRGSLGVMDIAEVTQAIALGAKSGQLTLSLAAGPGVIVFDRGRVVHAQFGRLVGEAAFAALAAAAHRESEATFSFNPLEGSRPDVERTIERSLESLLLSTAQEIDEGRAGTKGAVSRR